MSADEDSSAEDGGGRKKRRQRKVAPATEPVLHEAALRYLDRYGASTVALRRVLRRRVVKAERFYGEDPDALPAVERVIERLERAGLLDDRRFAASKALSLNRRGTSTRAIRYKLASSGLDSDATAAGLEALDDELGNADHTAAYALARRRRLGPFRRPEAREERREKDLAAMARAGFSFDLARRVVDAETPDALREELELDV